MVRKMLIELAIQQQKSEKIEPKLNKPKINISTSTFLDPRLNDRIYNVLEIDVKIDNLLKELQETNRLLRERLPLNSNKLERTMEDVSNNNLQINDKTIDFIQDEGKIEALILECAILGKNFYPDEIAMNHNLDLKTTMDVIQNMIKKGIINECEESSK